MCCVTPFCYIYGDCHNSNHLSAHVLAIAFATLFPFPTRLPLPFMTLLLCLMCHVPLLQYTPVFLVKQSHVCTAVGTVLYEVLSGGMMKDAYTTNACQMTHITPIMSYAIDMCCLVQGTALASVLAGKVAGHLRDQLGWNALRVRTFCQDIATLGALMTYGHAAYVLHGHMHVSVPACM